MSYCSNCDRTDISNRWQWCPRCGSHLSASATESAASKSAPAAGGPAVDWKGALVDLAFNVAERFVQNKVEQKIGDCTERLGFAVSSSASAGVKSGSPDWYKSTVEQKDHEPTPNELASQLAKQITHANAMNRMADIAIKHMQNMTSITTRS